MRITDRIHQMWSILYLFEYEKRNKNHTKKELEKIVSQLDGIINAIVHNPHFDTLVEMEKMMETISTKDA